MTARTALSRTAGKVTLLTGHYFLAVLAVVMIATDITFGLFGPASSVATGAAVVYVACMVLAQCASLSHDRHLCEKCATAVPLNPASEVTRWRTVLHAFHLRLFNVACFTVGIGFFIATLVIGAWDWWLLVPLQVVACVMLTPPWKHRRLAAWCPYCHWGHRGHTEPVPEVPDPAATR